MAKIILFRHGETIDNKDKRFSGWADPPLTPEGEEMARKVGEQLKDEKVTKAFSSDLSRSKRSLELALEAYHPDIPGISDKRLRERNYGDLTGQSKDELAKKYPVDFPLWHRSYDVPPPNGESIKQVEERVQPFIDELIKDLKPNDVVVICAHSNSLRPFLKFFEGLSNEEMTKAEHAPGTVYSYTI